MTYKCMVIHFMAVVNAHRVFENFLVLGGTIFRLLYGNLNSESALLSLGTVQQPEVAAQHPFRGGVSTFLPLPKAARS
jgi:hypothetical protein